MALTISPPANWNQTVNTIDTVVIDYTSPYPSANLTLFCETVKGTGDWELWSFPGPLPSSGSYYMHLATFNFIDCINVWPTDCHVDLQNAHDKSQFIHGVKMLLSTTTSGADGRTFSQSSTTSSSVSSSTTASQTTSTSSITSSSDTLSRTVLPTATGALVPEGSTVSSGLSQPAKIGISISVTLGVLLAIALGAWIILHYRKGKAQIASDVRRYEKAELLGHPVAPYTEAPIPMRSPPPRNGVGDERFPDTSYQGHYFPPQELPQTSSQSYFTGSDHDYAPVRRYELP